MKIQKIILSLVFITLFLFIFTQSASAATCGRVDTAGGDYYYQCNNTRITQIAVTIVGDTITNFTNSDTDASWDFHDGINNVTTTYHSTLFDCKYSDSDPVSYWMDYYPSPWMMIQTNSTMLFWNHQWLINQHQFDTPGVTWTSPPLIGVFTPCDPIDLPGAFDNCQPNSVNYFYSNPYYYFRGEFKRSFGENAPMFEICRSIAKPPCFLTTPQEIYLTISSNTQNYDLFTAAGSPSCPVNVNLTINSGITVSSATTSKAAIYGSQNLPTGSTVKIINNGTIHGMGGRGGVIIGSISKTSFRDTMGFKGGDAIQLSAKTTIENNGSILGGGGGGAGATILYALNADWTHDFSGGGGGAGGGAGGDAVKTTGLYYTTNSIASTCAGCGGYSGTTGVSGAGGAAKPSRYNNPAFIGGNGGNYGEAGGNSFYKYITGARILGESQGGAPGKSINTNGFCLSITGNTPTTVKGEVGGVSGEGCNPISIPTPTINLTISSNTQNYNLYTAAGSPTSKVDIVLTINPGVTVSSNTTSRAAIYGSQNLPTGSTVKIINNGTIHGMGGRGGVIIGSISKTSFRDTMGFKGGDAIQLSAKTTIENNGSILGGGGGGAGITVLYTLNDDWNHDFSGGSGGAGGGAGGDAVRTGGFDKITNNILSTCAGCGGYSGTTGVSGTGGAAKDSRYGSSFPGGKGGNYGEAGENSFYKNVTGSPILAESQGGAPGKSINTNGFCLSITGNTPTTVKGEVGGVSGEGCDTSCGVTQTKNFTISSDTQNYDLFTAAGSPSCPVNVNLTINSGVTVSSATTSKAAIWGSQNLPIGSTVNIINKGKILGMGGDTAHVYSTDSIYNQFASSYGAALPGLNGGNAISLSASTTIQNTQGYIFSGGGGGGGAALIMYVHPSYGPAWLAYTGGGGASNGISFNTPRFGIPGSYLFNVLSGTNGTSITNGQGISYTHANFQLDTGNGGYYGENGGDAILVPTNKGIPTYTLPGGLAGKSVLTNSFYLCLHGNTPDRVKGTILGTRDTNCDSTPVPEKPVTPTLEKASSMAYSMSCDTAIKINWSTSANATTYKLYRATTNTIDNITKPNDSAYVGPIFTSNTVFTYNDMAFTKGKRNHYIVEACNDTGCTKSDNVYVDILSQCDDRNDLSGFVPTSIGAQCKATQGTSTKIYLNKQTAWEITPTGATPRDLEWFSYFTLGASAEKKLNSTTTLNTIYTTVGLKYINATTTWRDPSAKKIYTASCSTSTNVIPGGDIIREI